MKYYDLSLIEDSGSDQEKIPRPPAGGYICKIIGVEDKPQYEGILIEFDIASGEYKNYFDKLMAKTGRWSGEYWLSYKETAAIFFKRFITSLERSNVDYKYVSQDGVTANEKEMIGKFIGIIIGEEEVKTKKGDVIRVLKARGIRSVSSISDGDFDIPELKKLEEDKKIEKTNSTMGTTSKGWQ